MHVDLARPKKLYRYSDRQWLEKSLQHGEFRIRPASDYKFVETDQARHDDEIVRTYSTPGKDVIITLQSGQLIEPLGDIQYRNDVGTNYLTLCFSSRWDHFLFEDFPNTDSCLVIHEVEEFCERMHLAAATELPEWAGLDGAVLYGGSSPLGAIFSKPLQFIAQHEWRFAWRPPVEHIELLPISISVGSIERIAEIVLKPSQDKASWNQDL